MHSLFSDWLRESGLDLQNRPLAEWWQALEEYCSTTTRATLLVLLRFAVIRTSSEADVPEGFREAIKAKDSGFSMRGNVFEVQQLARVAVRTLFEGAGVSEERAHAAALGLICGSFGRDNGNVYREHVQRASEFLAKAADELRIRDETNLPSDARDIAKSLSESPDVNKLKALLASLVPGMVSTLNDLTRRLVLQEEELNMLWWTFGEQSRDLKVAFRDLSPGQAAVLAAKELADLTAFPPGPVSFEGILCRALAADSLDQKMRLEDVTNSLDSKWRTSLAEPLSSLGDALTILPVHLMIKKSVETSSKKAWPVLFRAVCDVSTALKASPRAISSQFYYERMFVKSLEYID